MDFNPVYFTNKLIEAALDRNASDIHFHPRKDSAALTLRIDGTLQDFDQVPLDLFQAVVNRLKIMSNLGSNINNLPQDGRLEYFYKDYKRDLRISIIPSLFGESIVIRILMIKSAIPKLENLGMSESLLNSTREILGLKEGLVLSTGPTGSGKTTTMYALLQTVFESNPNIHVISIEDPIEYQFPEFTQIQVNDNIGLTFPAVLRAVLRHDPDIILVGEIRDRETAEIAIRAALTGHLVFATMHTNDANSTINRFLEFKINPALLADSLKAIYNQRLEKEPCKNCQGTGCDRCHYTGFFGRKGAYELLIIDENKKQELLLPLNSNYC